MNRAQLLIEFISSDSGDVQAPIEVFSQSDDCHKCPLLPLGKIEKNGNKTAFTLPTMYPTAFRVDRQGKEVCSFNYHFEEYSTYDFTVSDVEGDNKLSCGEIKQIIAGDNPYLPLLYELLVLLGFGIVWTIGKWLFRKYRTALTDCFTGQRIIRSDLGTPASPPILTSLPRSNLFTPPSVVGTSSTQLIASPPAGSNDRQASPSKTKQRLRSLDTFRGLALILMIFANYGGGSYYFFWHATWDGLTCADLLFPWFVWIMGVALAFSFRGPLRRGDSRFYLVFRVFKRTAILFMLGLVSNTICSTPHLSRLRIMGVLQRLAISYFFCAILEIAFGKPAMTLLENRSSSRLWSIVNFFWDIIGSLPQWLFIICLVTVHTCITFLLPFEGCPTGYLGPGGLHEGGKYYNCTGGATQLVDRVILGENHMFEWPTCRGMYKTKVPFDPEGLLGCLTSIPLCYLGLHAGRICTLYPTTSGRLGRWLTWAVIWGLAAGLLCNFSQFDGVIPLNKNLWSLSFVFALSSMALVLLSLMYVVCDVFKIWSGAPFIYPGMNSIVVYMAHELLGSNFPVKWHVDYGVRWQVLAMNLWGPTIFTIMAVVMYHKKVFIAI